MTKRVLPALGFLLLVLGACNQGGQADVVSAVTARRGQTVPTLLTQYMPGAMEDGMVKIAVLVNQKSNGIYANDSSSQFIDGCVTEGRSMGFTVDAFVSGGDETRCREIAAGIAKANYDGLIFSNGLANNRYIDASTDFSWDILKPVSDNGIPIVTFEALPYKDGKALQGLSTTFQDDYSLARLSLETLLSFGQTDARQLSPGRPLRVIRIGAEPGITFFDRRTWEFDQMVNEGKIIEVAFVKLGSLNNPQSTAQQAIAAILPQFPVGTVDALWVPWDEFASGCAGALAAAGRQDIKMVSIGISNNDIRLMQQHSSIWLANVAVDPKLAGTVNMRILAAKLAGETMTNTFSFAPQLVKTADLNHTVNIANLSLMIPGWGEGKGLFDNYQWMDDLKTANARYLRIPPTLSSNDRVDDTQVLAP